MIFFLLGMTSHLPIVGKDFFDCCECVWLFKFTEFILHGSLEGSGIYVFFYCLFRNWQFKIYCLFRNKQCLFWNWRRLISQLPAPEQTLLVCSGTNIACSRTNRTEISFIDCLFRNKQCLFWNWQPLMSKLPAPEQTLLVLEQAEPKYFYWLFVCSGTSSVCSETDGV